MKTLQQSTIAATSIFIAASEFETINSFCKPNASSFTKSRNLFSAAKKQTLKTHR